MVQASNPDGRVKYPPVPDGETCAHIIDSRTKTVCGAPAVGYVTLISGLPGRDEARARVAMCDKHKRTHNAKFSAHRHQSPA